MKKPASSGLFHATQSDGAAAVLAVRLLGRVGDHVGLHLLHLAATGQELLHGTGQRIALLLLGFDAGQLLDLDGSGFLALAGRGGDSPSSLSSPLSSAAASSSPSSSSPASSSSCSSSSSLILLPRVLQEQVSYSPVAPGFYAPGKITMPRRRGSPAPGAHRPDRGVRRGRSPARYPGRAPRHAPARSAGSPAGST